MAAARPHLPQVPFRVVPIDSPYASRRIGLVWRQDFPKADDLRRLGSLVREQPPRGTRPVVDGKPVLREQAGAG